MCGLGAYSIYYTTTASNKYASSGVAGGVLRGLEGSSGMNGTSLIMHANGWAGHRKSCDAIPY